ncbi:MAG TPA: hypothetical protein VIS72_07630 [Anaerolineales bacterium]
MKNKSFSRIPYYFFRQRIPLGHPLTTTRLELATPYPKTEMSNKTLLENILQWEDDGGRIGETQISTPEQLLV